MGLSEVWEDDMLAFIGFLVLILPVPFIYSALSSLGSSNHLILASKTFLATGFLWMVVAALYSLYLKRKRSDDVADMESV